MNRCPSCGEYDATYVSHETTGPDGDGHLTCSNCDWGLCPECA